MLVLLGTTITASFFDSLNPSAIAQQMLLQAMVKNKRHILFFILGIGLANIVMGLAVYYGIATWVAQLLSTLTAAYPAAIYGAELGAGLLCLAIGIRLLVKTRRSRSGESGECAAKPPARLAPLPLFFMGAAFCAVELTSALPYFGFLAVLAGYHLAFPLVLGFISLYSFIYAFPLLLLYFGYNRLQGTAVIQRLERVLGKVSAYILPAAVSLLGLFLLFHGVSSLL